jgi:ABC-type nitrate/sulfonate/bicarbonate transport system substrate-binding protein
MTKKEKTLNSPRKSLSFSIILIYIFLAMFFIGALFSVSMFFNAQRLTEVRLGLVWINQPQFAGVYTAIEKGFYAEEGLRVVLDEYTGEESIDDKLADGMLDFTISQPVSFLKSVDKGNKLKAVAAIYQKSPLAFIHKSELQLTNPQDFLGKKVGYRGDPVTPTLFSVILSELDLSEDELEILRLDFESHQYQDIRDGKVDIVSVYRTDQVYLFEKNNLAYELILPENFGFEMYGDVIVTSEEMIKNKQKTVQKFVDATLRGWEYAAEHPEEALEFTDKYITASEYKDPEYNKFILERSLSLITDFPGTKIGDMHVSKWRNLHDLLVSDGTIHKELNIDNVFTTDFIR